MKTHYEMKSKTVKMSGIAILLLALNYYAMAGNGSNATPEIKLNITVTNSGNATVELLNKKTSLMEVFKTDANGKVSIKIKPKTNYELFIKKAGFEISDIKLSVDDITESAEYNENIQLRKSDFFSITAQN